ncbi:MAG: hypothetical protein CMB79_24480 [Filomicrobium sp.]|nr:hypothetical protein [Filomicrobium sp.]
MEKSGFGPNGKPTLRQLSLAISGRTSVTSFVRKFYLAPYLKFSEQYFGRRLTEDEPIDLADVDNRWNLARTVFRLESGRKPIMKRRAFECGLEFGSDVIADFDAAGVERGANDPIKFVRFKGIEFYAKDCLAISEQQSAHAEAESTSTAARTELAVAEAMIAAQQERIEQLTADLAQLRAAIAIRNLAIEEAGDKLQNSAKKP